MLQIILSLVAAAYASPLPVDTPEVAAAKAAHFAEVQRAAVAVGAPAWYPYLGYSSAGAPAITPDGFVADTPEVSSFSLASDGEILFFSFNSATKTYHTLKYCFVSTLHLEKAK